MLRSGGSGLRGQRHDFTPSGPHGLLSFPRFEAFVRFVPRSPSRIPYSDPEPSMETKPTIAFDDFAKLDLRVATIVEAEAHPNADKLLKLQIDLGEEKRQICAGIRPYVDDPASLVGQQIVVVANLEPRKIRGEQSNGMLLAASVMEGDTTTDVVTLTPSKPTPPGSTVG